MGKVKFIFDKAVEVLIMIIMAAMSFIVLWQVITRFILHNPSVWTEEVAKYLMVWIGFLAGAMGLKYGTHLGLTLLSDSIHNRAVRLFLDILVLFLCAAVGVIILVYGWQYMQAGAKKLASAVPISMNYVYAVIPLSGVVILLNCAEKLLHIIRTHNDGKEA